MLNEKALRIAFKSAPDAWNCKKSHLEIIEGCITVYLSTVTPAEVGGLVAELRDEDFRHEMQHLRSSVEIDRLFQQAATALEAQAAKLARMTASRDGYAKDAASRATALTTERAAHAETRRERDDYLNKAFLANIDKQTAETQRDEALKALEHDQWSIIDRAIERYSNSEISDLHALGLITSGFLKLDAARDAARRVREGGKVDG